LDEAAEYARLCTVRENREVRTMATTWSERVAAQGREEGLQTGRQVGRREGVREGRQKGLQEGLQAVRKILLGLLEQRFGPLPAATRERIEAISSLDRLTRLSERALTARSLAALRLH
jgi:flagellar biosynthesis/type III secretory pathway protein FliH